MCEKKKIKDFLITELSTLIDNLSTNPLPWLIANDRFSSSNTSTARKLWLMRLDSPVYRIQFLSFVTIHSNSFVLVPMNFSAHQKKATTTTTTMAQIHFRSIFSLIKASNFHIRDFLVAQRSCRWKCFHSFSIEFGGAYWWLFRGEPKGGSKRRDTTPINREFAALLSKIFHQLEEKFEIQTERFSFFLFGFFSSPMSSSHSLKVRKKKLIS